MSNGFYLAQDGHIVSLFSPVDITGGKTAQAFSMKNYSHASIIIMIGASAAAPTKILVNAVTDAAGDTPVAIPFDLYAAETSNVDVLAAKQSVTAAGYTPSANDGIFYVIELNSMALGSAGSGYSYVQLQITNGTNSVIAGAVAILSGARFAGDQSPTDIT